VNRYAIGDRTPTLSLGSDGSLDIAIQRAEPGGALSGNWLPALAGAARFILLMRAYLPGKPMIDRRYVLPPVLPA
jgi:DNA sulfur modification protein DndE